MVLALLQRSYTIRREQGLQSYQLLTLELRASMMLPVDVIAASSRRATMRRQHIVRARPTGSGKRNDRTRFSSLTPTPSLRSMQRDATGFMPQSLNGRGCTFHQTLDRDRRPTGARTVKAIADS